MAIAESERENDPVVPDRAATPQFPVASGRVLPEEARLRVDPTAADHGLGHLLGARARRAVAAAVTSEPPAEVTGPPATVALPVVRAPAPQATAGCDEIHTTTATTAFWLRMPHPSFTGIRPP